MIKLNALLEHPHASLATAALLNRHVTRTQYR